MDLMHITVASHYIGLLYFPLVNLRKPSTYKAQPILRIQSAHQESEGIT